MAFVRSLAVGTALLVAIMATVYVSTNGDVVVSGRVERKLSPEADETEAAVDEVPIVNPGFEDEDIDYEQIAEEEAATELEMQQHALDEQMIQAMLLEDQALYELELAQEIMDTQADDATAVAQAMHHEEQAEQVLNEALADEETLLDLEDASEVAAERNRRLERLGNDAGFVWKGKVYDPDAVEHYEDEDTEEEDEEEDALDVELVRNPHTE